MVPIVTPLQFAHLVIAQRLFIASQLLNFPLYYLPWFRDLFNGDGANTKFPCSISWMTRTGAARAETLVFWNAGWYFMLRAFLAPTWRCAFMLQMYATGFITVVLTPMMGPDVALGAADYIHCYSAMIYVFDHWIANEFILGVPLLSPYGICFAVTASVCGVFQFLRADNDLFARKLHTRTGMSSKSFATFKSILEIGFMLTENLLFFIFLFGMTSGVTPESFALAAKVTPPTKDEDAGGASSPPPTMMDAFVVSLIIAAVAALWLRRGNLGAAAPAAEATKAKKTPAAKPKTKTPAAKAKRLWPRTSLRARPRTSTPTGRAARSPVRTR